MLSVLFRIERGADGGRFGIRIGTYLMPELVCNGNCVQLDLINKSCASGRHLVKIQANIVCARDRDGQVGKGVLDAPPHHWHASRSFGPLKGLNYISGGTEKHRGCKVLSSQVHEQLLDRNGQDLARLGLSDRLGGDLDTSHCCSRGIVRLVL